MSVDFTTLLQQDFHFDSRFFELDYNTNLLPILSQREEPEIQNVQPEHTRQSIQSNQGALKIENASDWAPLPVITPSDYIAQKSMNQKSINYVDISDLLVLSQRKAAEKLGIPSSTMSKRWKEVDIFLLALSPRQPLTESGQTRN